MLAVTFFLLPLSHYTYIHGSYFFWLMNASAGGKALPPAFFFV